jgi:branched-subunit amino acid transport protein
VDIEGLSVNLLMIANYIPYAILKCNYPYIICQLVTTILRIIFLEFKQQNKIGNTLLGVEFQDVVCYIIVFVVGICLLEWNYDRRNNRE